MKLRPAILTVLRRVVEEKHEDMRRNGASLRRFSDWVHITEECVHERNAVECTISVRLCCNMQWRINAEAARSLRHCGGSMHCPLEKSRSSSRAAAPRDAEAGRASRISKSGGCRVRLSLPVPSETR